MLHSLLAAGLVSLGLLTPKQSSAAIPSLAQVGVVYVEFLTRSQDSAHGSGQNPAASLNATLPFGTNAAYYAYYRCLYAQQAGPAESTAGAIRYYYYYLGDLYAYQNYQYPSYAATLQGYYHNYGDQQSQAYENSVSPTIDYYASVAQYYASLAFP